MKTSVGVLLICLSLFSAGCARPEAQTAGGHESVQHTINIASAASMKPALSIIAEGFQRKTGDQTEIILGSSGLLARQIETGAPYDVYISANADYMRELVKKGLIVDAKPYAKGVLVLVGKAKTLDDLKKRSIENIVIANPASAPYGAAAKEALEKAGLLAALESKLVASDNVVQAYDYVATGNVDAGLVALSLVKATKTRYTRVDSALYQPIEQWAGVVSRTESTETAQRFVAYLNRPSTQKTLKKFGFEAVGARN